MLGEGQATAGRSLGALVLVFIAAAARADVIQITMEKVAYSPAQVSAHVGDTIEWLNSDIVAHTASSRTGEWDLVITPKQKKSVTLKSTGNFEYYCKFHPNMVGEITVTR
jgi:plastocyanin